MFRPIERYLPEEASLWVDGFAPPGEIETVPLAGSVGRVLARDTRADADIPPRSLAAIDGFALKAADTVGAGDYSPLALALRPGAPWLTRGEARPVVAGEPLPEGVDAVLPLELGDVLGATLEVAAALAGGDGVVLPGAECRAGEVLLSEGQRLRPQDVAWLARAGFDGLPVWCKPAVRIVLAGRFERDADGPMLVSLVERDGGRLEGLSAAPEATSLEAALRQPGADLILVAGGTGDGAADQAVASLGRAGQVHIHRVAIHPGDRAALGRVGATPVALLPGTPLACLAAYDLLAARLLRRLARLPGPWPYRSRVLPLGAKLVSAIGRMDLCRVRVREGLVGSVEPLAVTDGHTLATAVRAAGFVVVPPESEGYPAGAEVTVHLYE